MRIYISGPMTGVKEFNFPEFNALAEILRYLGYEVVNPAENFDGATDLAWEDYLREDIKQILTVDAIVVLEGWEESRGAQIEVAVGKALGLPILARDLLTYAPTILEEAGRLTSRDRQQVYGHPLDDFTMTAELWTARFRNKLREGESFVAEEVATAQRLVKESRLERSPEHRDSLLDIAGYARTQEMCGEERRDREERAIPTAATT